MLANISNLHHFNELDTKIKGSFNKDVMGLGLNVRQNGPLD